MMDERNFLDLFDPPKQGDTIRCILNGVEKDCVYGVDLPIPTREQIAESFKIFPTAAEVEASLRQLDALEHGEVELRPLYSLGEQFAFNQNYVNLSLGAISPAQAADLSLVTGTKVQPGGVQVNPFAPSFIGAARPEYLYEGGPGIQPTGRPIPLTPEAQALVAESRQVQNDLIDYAADLSRQREEAMQLDLGPEDFNTPELKRQLSEALIRERQLSLMGVTPERSLQPSGFGLIGIVDEPAPPSFSPGGASLPAPEPSEGPQARSFLGSSLVSGTTPLLGFQIPGGQLGLAAFVFGSVYALAQVFKGFRS